jgi:hypothetical protein
VPTNDSDTGDVATSLSGTGVDSVLSTDAGSDAVAFDAVDTDETVTKTVTVTNTAGGERSVEVQLGGSDADAFSVRGGSAFTLASGERRSVTVAFAPTAFGNASANLQFDTPAAGSAPVSVGLVGTGRAPNVTLADAVAFGSVGKGRSTTVTTTVTNDGTAPLNVTDVSVQGADADAFAVRTTTTPTVAPGEQQSYTVAFEPSTAGTLTASLTVSSNATQRPVTTDLNGTALAPQIGASTENLNFGNVTLGTTKTLTMTVTNPSGSPADLTIARTDVSGPDSSAFVVTNDPTGTLAPGQSQQLTVAFTPATASDRKQAQLRVFSDAGTDSQLDVWLSNTRTVVIVDEVRDGAASTPKVSVDANNVDPDATLSLNVSQPSTRQRPVGIEGLNMTVPSGGYFTMNITQAANASDVGADPYDPGEDRDTLQHIELTHTLPNEEYEDTGVTYRVERVALANDTAPGDVTFRRFANGTWNEHVSTLARTTATHYVYTVETRGFSQFVVTGPAETTPGGTGPGNGESGGNGGSGGSGGSTTGPSEADDPPSQSLGTAVTVTALSGDAETAASQRIDVTGAAAGETVSIDLGNASTGDGDRNATAGASGDRPIVVDGIDLTVARDGNVSLRSATRDVPLPDEGTATSARRLAIDRLSPEGRAFLRETGLRPTGFIEIDHDVSDENVTAVTHRFRVRKSYLDATASAPGDVGLYRKEAGGWTPLETRLVGESDDYYRFAADSPGLSVFGIGARSPVFEVRNATATTVAGGTVRLNATVANVGARAGQYDATLGVAGVTVDDATVTVPAGESRSVSLRGQVSDAGSLAVSLSGTGVGTVEIADATATPQAQEPTATDVDQQASSVVTTPSETGGSVPTLLVVAVVVLVVAVVAVVRRRG